MNAPEFVTFHVVALYKKLLGPRGPSLKRLREPRAAIGAHLQCNITTIRQVQHRVLQFRVSIFITSEIQFNEVVLDLSCRIGIGIAKNGIAGVW